MLVKTMLDPSKLYTSLLFGRGLYQYAGERVFDPLRSAEAVEGTSPLLVNVLTGEQFYARRLACTPAKLNRIRKQVLAPCRRDVVLWPSDVVSLPAEEEDVLTLYANNQYTDVPKDPAERGGQWALLFPYKDETDDNRLDTVLQRMENSTWKNEKVRKLAIQIVSDIDWLNQHGYVYEDFHLSRFIVRPGRSVYLDYSPLMYAFTDLSSNEAAELCAPKAGEYPLEFMEPSYVRGRINWLDYNAQNYQLCALLFFLLYGRHAYDGRLLVGYSDDDAIQHYAKYRNYHEMPVFIFDETDSRNALGTFDEDEDEIKLWQKSPASLRELFLHTLNADSAMRIDDVDNPLPRTWLQEFDALGWLDNMGDLKGPFA